MFREYRARGERPAATQLTSPNGSERATLFLSTKARCPGMITNSALSGGGAARTSARNHRSFNKADRGLGSETQAQSGLVLTGGSQCHAPEPPRFLICKGLSAQALLKEADGRLRCLPSGKFPEGVLFWRYKIGEGAISKTYLRSQTAAKPKGGGRTKHGLAEVVEERRGVGESKRAYGVTKTHSMKVKSVVDGSIAGVAVRSTRRA